MQIFFCSRTHSQLAQFVNEIKKTRFGERIQCVTLGSRKSLCINSNVTALSSDLRMTDRCLDLQKKRQPKTEDGKRKKKQCQCPYYEAQGISHFRNHALAKLRDIEELAELGDTLGACSYYGVRKALPLAQVVALPYSMLLNKTTRMSVGIHLKNNIVICDEAHNIVEAVNQIHSCQVTRFEVRVGFPSRKY